MQIKPNLLYFTLSEFSKFEIKKKKKKNLTLTSFGLYIKLCFLQENVKIQIFKDFFLKSFCEKDHSTFLW